MSEAAVLALITAVSEAVNDLIATVEGKPTSEQVEAAIKTAMLNAAELQVKTEFPNG